MTANKTKRVLSLSTLFPNAAHPRFGIFVAKSLEALQQETHWDVTLVNPIGLPPITFGRYRTLARAAQDGREFGFPVHRPVFRLLPKIGGRLNPRLIARSVLPLVRQLHAENPFDLVDAQFFYPDGPAAMAIASDLDLPLSVKARGADIHFWGARGYGCQALQRTASAAAGVLAVCEALADDMATLGIAREAITVHYTGLDRDLFRPLDHAGLRTRLATTFDLPQARLLLVGKGEDEASLRALAREVGVADRVHFLGSLEPAMLPPILSAADAMVLPSASEGLANAWIEALACGTRLVITDAGGAREVVTAPEAGVIVARNCRAVRDGIRLVTENPRTSQAVAATVDDFSWETNGRRLAAYYDSLLR